MQERSLLMHRWTHQCTSVALVILPIRRELCVMTNRKIYILNCQTSFYHCQYLGDELHLLCVGRESKYSYSGLGTVWFEKITVKTFCTVSHYLVKLGLVSGMLDNMAVSQQPTL